MYGFIYAECAAGREDGFGAENLFLFWVWVKIG